MQEKLRNTPRQQRADETVGYITEAAARLLDGKSEDAPTTNHIADRAGISVGTLYRYFSSKWAILDHLIDREIERVERRQTDFLESATDLTAEEIIDQIVDTMLSAFQGRHFIRKRLLGLRAHFPGVEERLLQARLRVLLKLETRLIETNPSRFRPLSSEERVWLLGALIGALNTIVQHASHDIGSSDNKLRLRNLVLSMLEHS